MLTVAPVKCQVGFDLPHYDGFEWRKIVVGCPAGCSYAVQFSGVGALSSINEVLYSRYIDISYRTTPSSPQRSLEAWTVLRESSEQ